MSGEGESTACALETRGRTVLHPQNGCPGRRSPLPLHPSSVLCTSSCLSPTQSFNPLLPEKSFQNAHRILSPRRSKSSVLLPLLDLETKAKCLTWFTGSHLTYCLLLPAPHSSTSSFSRLHSFPQGNEGLPWSHLLLPGTLDSSLPREVLLTPTPLPSLFRRLSFLLPLIPLVSTPFCLPVPPH